MRRGRRTHTSAAWRNRRLTLRRRTASLRDEATQTKRPRRGAPKAHGPREGSKTATVLALLKRAGGVSSQDLMDATGWQAHSVRGFLSGTVVKKLGLAVVFAKGKDGTRKYSIQR